MGPVSRFERASALTSRRWRSDRTARCVSHLALERPGRGIVRRPAQEGSCRAPRALPWRCGSRPDAPQRRSKRARTAPPAAAPASFQRPTPSALDTLAEEAAGVGVIKATAWLTPALIRYIYPPERLGQGLGIYALVVGVAFTAGPTVASAVLAVAGWPWLFLANVPICLVAAGLTFRSLPATERGERHFDGLSAALCAGLFALLLFGLSGFVHRMAWHWTVAAWAGAAACGYALLRRDVARPPPILAVDLFRRPLFSLSSATSVCAFTVQGLALVVLPFWLHTALGFSQSQTGLLINPWPATLAVMALIAAPLSDRYSPGLLGGGGLLVLSGGLASLALMPADPGPIDIVWRLALCGVGFGFFQAPNMKAIMASAPRERSGGASGIVATSCLLGQALGAALVALCLSVFPAGGAKVTVWVGCCIAILGSLMSLSRLLPSVRGRG